MQTTVIYADILFVLNFFITFLLLSITFKLLKKSPPLYRLLIAAAAGGAYSFVIFADKMAFATGFAAKLAAACIMVLISQRFYSVFSFFKAVGVFFFSNMLFLGIISALWFAFKPEGVVVNNSSIYFNVSAGVLLFSALAAYLITAVVLRIVNSCNASKQIYSLKIECGSESVSVFALADTGNKLREPFSGAGVIIVNSKEVEKIAKGRAQRVIVCKTVSGSSCMNAFKPDRVIVKTGKKEVELGEVYIALSSNALENSEFSAVINPKIISE